MPEALVQRREDEAVGRRVEPVELLRREPAEEDGRRRRSRARAPARGAPARAASGSPAGRAAAARRPGSGRAPRGAARRFLCGRLAETLSSTRRSPRPSRSRTAPRAAGHPRRHARCPAARRRPFRGDVEAGDQVARVLFEIAITRSRAAGRRGHEHAHAETPDPEVRLGDDQVEQVVDGGDAREAAPGRRRVGQAVHEVHTVTRGPSAAACTCSPRTQLTRFAARTGISTCSSRRSRARPSRRPPC